MSTAGRLVAAFAERFEPEGADYILWRRPGRDGVLVTAVERDQLLSVYGSRVSRLTWIVNFWMLLGVSLALLWVQSRLGWLNDWSLLYTFLLVSCAFLGALWLATRDVEDAVAGNPPIARTMSGRERRRRAFEAVSWKKTLWDTVFPILWLAVSLTQPERDSLFWWFSCTLALTTLAVSLYQVVWRLLYVWHEPSRR